MLYPKNKIFGNQPMDILKKFNLKIWNGKLKIKLKKDFEFIITTISKYNDQNFYFCRHYVVLKVGVFKTKCKTINIFGDEEIVYLDNIFFTNIIYNIQKNFGFTVTEYDKPINENYISSYWSNRFLILL